MNSGDKYTGEKAYKAGKAAAKRELRTVRAAAMFVEMASTPKSDWDRGYDDAAREIAAS